MLDVLRIKKVITAVLKLPRRVVTTEIQCNYLLISVEDAGITYTVRYHMDAPCDFVIHDVIKNFMYVLTDQEILNYDNDIR